MRLVAFQKAGINSVPQTWIEGKIESKYVISAALLIILCLWSYKAPMPLFQTLSCQAIQCHYSTEPVQTVSFFKRRSVIAIALFTGLVPFMYFPPVIRRRDNGEGGRMQPVFWRTLSHGPTLL